MKATIAGTRLRAWLRDWPCHGLDSLETIVFEFDAAGNLVDIEMRDESGRIIERDSEALVALAEDASIEHGMLTHVSNATLERLRAMSDAELERTYRRAADVLRGEIDREFAWRSLCRRTIF